MRYMLIFIFALLPTLVGAQDDEIREVLLPFVTLVPPPTVPKLEAASLPQERSDEIKQLIGQLSGIAERDLWINFSYYGPKFTPVGEFDVSGAWTGKSVEVFDPIRRLVEIGPDALPHLLASLEDDSPTEVVVKAVENRGLAIGRWLAFDEILHGNPANPIEQFTLKLNRFPVSASIRPQDDFLGSEMESYRVKIGDVCLVVMGQIVGRDYLCLSAPHLKSSGILICSPVHREELRRRLREIWKSRQPRQKLLESLLLDFSTRSMATTDFFEHSDIGEYFQIESAKRLLYYYPDVSVPIIVDRLNNLSVSDDPIDDWVSNGVQVSNLIDSVAWSENEDLKSALSDLALKVTEESQIQALLRAGVQISDRQ